MRACALAPNGVPVCWDDSNIGPLAVRSLAAALKGNDSTHTPPSNPDGFRFSQIDVGQSLFCGVTQPEQAIHCWGNTMSGQPRDSADFPPCTGGAPESCEAERLTRVVGETSSRGDVAWHIRFVQVSSGSSLACGIDVAGVAYCWGSNYRCALGRCREPDSFRAHRIQIPGRVVEIGAGYWFACARTADGRIFCWGDNTTGQLGSLASVNAGPDGLPPDYRDAKNAALQNEAHADPCFLGGRCSPAPVEVTQGRHWAALAVGTNHACALASDDGGVYCWGGSDPIVLGSDAPLTLCVNRSATWKDVRCQPIPVRVAGLATLAPPIASTGKRDSLRARVRVSRRELRAEFHTDDMRGWGWPAGRSGYASRYSWSLRVAGMDGPRTLLVILESYEPGAREFSSLAELIAAARAIHCSDGMLGDCDISGISATTDGDAVVLVLRDSARIARLFGMRPAFVQAWEKRPESDRSSSDSVRVEYVEPMLPEPDAAMRADAAQSLRRHEERISRVSRFIDASGDHGTALWLVVGDSMGVYVNESHCKYDSCYVGAYPSPTDSGWSVTDPTIARLQPLVPDSARGFGLDAYDARWVLKALRPGRTSLRVHGVHSASDSAASARPPQHVLERDVLVTRPIGRIEITPRPDTVGAHRPLVLTTRVVDIDGQPIADVPVTISVQDSGNYGSLSLTPTPITLISKGRKRIVASTRRHADTLTVTVVDSTYFPNR
jgi:hypothetical protein